MNEESDIPSVPEAVHSSTTESFNGELAPKTGNPQQEAADEKIVGPTLFQRIGSLDGQDPDELKNMKIELKLSKDIEVLTYKLEDSRKEVREAKAQLDQKESELMAIREENNALKTREAEIDQYKKDLDEVKSRIIQFELFKEASELKKTIDTIRSDSGEEDETNQLETLRLVWNEIFEQVDTNIEVFKDKEIVRIIENIADESVDCGGKPFVLYLLESKDRFEKFLSIYQFYSREVNEAVKKHGEDILKRESSVHHVKIWRIRTSMMQMFEFAIPEDQAVEEWFFSPLIDTVFSDYQRNEPAESWPMVLFIVAKLFANLTETRPDLLPKILSISEDLIKCTIEMIRKDMDSCPHRSLYLCLSNLADKSFPFLLTHSEETIRFAIDAFVYHLSTDRNYTLLAMIKNAAALSEQEAQSFYKKHYLHLVQRVFEFAVDPKNVKYAVDYEFSVIMCRMFRSLESSIKVPLNGANPNQSNIEFISDHLCNILVQHFTMDEARVLIEGFFYFRDDKLAMMYQIRFFIALLKKKRSD